MEIPKYLQVLWSYKWLLFVGLVVAIIAGLLAGYTLKDGQVVSRTTLTYTAQTTTLVESSRPLLLQSEIPGQEITAESGTTEPIIQDLSSLAVVYAYLAAGEEIEARVVSQIGPLAEDESITATSRTTQPTGSETFPGRLNLPILSVVGISTSAERAELISRTANDEFQDYLVEQQDDDLIPEDIRVVLSTLKESPADDGVGSNPAIPMVVAGLGTFLIFVVLAFILYGARVSRAKRNEVDENSDDSAPVGGDPVETEAVATTPDVASEETAGRRARRSSSVGSGVRRTAQPDSDDARALERALAGDK